MKKLTAHDCKLAREIVAWKERVAQAWPGVHVVDFKRDDQAANNAKTGDKVVTEITVDTNGLGKDVVVEEVVYRIENGEEKLWRRDDFKLVAENGNLLTYKYDTKVLDPGFFRVGFRIYPKNAALPHRQDFAYVKWI